MSGEPKANTGKTASSAVNGAAYPKDVLFYGDSLTWGMAHKYTGRYEVTWPRMLERRLNARGYNVVESALCSRTTASDDSANQDWLVGGEPHDFNGMAHFTPEFMAHDCRAVVILLGTNDLKVRVRSQTRLRGRVDAQSIANSAAKIGLLAMQAHKDMPRLKGHPLTVVLVTPPPVKSNLLSKELGYDETSVKISHEFPAAYKKAAKDNGFEFVHVKSVDMESSVDGVHVTPEATREIAEAVWEVLERCLEKRAPIATIAPPDSDEDSGNEEDASQKRTGNTKSKSKKEEEAAKKRNARKDDTDTRKRRKEEPTSRRQPRRTADSDGESSDALETNEVDIRDSVTELVWNQCEECGKWRMAPPIALKKAHWTCKNEFWSDRLEEWKVGCGWSSDPYKDDAARQEPVRGDLVKNNRLAVVQKQRAEARARAVALLSARTLSRRSDSDSDEEEVKLKGTRPRKNDVKDTKVRVIPTAKKIDVKKKITSETVAHHAESPSPTSSEESSVQQTQASVAKDALATGTTEGSAPGSDSKKRRGRPPGSVNRPKALPPLAGANGISAILPPGMQFVQALPMQGQAAGAVGESGAVPVLARPKAFMPVNQSQQNQQQQQMKASPMTMPRGIQMAPTLMPLIQTYHPGMAAAGTQAAMFAHQGMMMARPQLPQGFQSQQPSQQQTAKDNQAKGAQKQSSDIIKSNLIPYIERISVNIPQQYHQTIANFVAILKTDAIHPMILVQAYAELRQLFAAFPQVIQEMDAIVQNHPMLSAFFVQTAAPQVIFYHDPQAAAAMQNMQQVAFAAAQPSMAQTPTAQIVQLGRGGIIQQTLGTIPIRRT